MKKLYLAPESNAQSSFVRHKGDHKIRSPDHSPRPASTPWASQDFGDYQEWGQGTSPRYREAYPGSICLLGDVHRKWGAVRPPVHQRTEASPDDDYTALETGGEWKHVERRRVPSEDWQSMFFTNKNENNISAVEQSGEVARFPCSKTISFSQITSHSGSPLLFRLFPFLLYFKLQLPWVSLLLNFLYFYQKVSK